MHKFGKMNCHLHATVPVPCNSKYSMLMSLMMMNILPTQKLQCCTIYKNISGQAVSQKTNSQPFLFRPGGNELGRRERVTVMFQHSTDRWLQKKSKQKYTNREKKSNKQIKARLLDNQPCKKEHPKMSQLNIPQGNLLKKSYYKYIYSQMVSCQVSIEELVRNEGASSIRGPSGSRLRQPKCHFQVNTNSTPNQGSYKLIIHTCFSIQQYTFLPF